MIPRSHDPSRSFFPPTGGIPADCLIHKIDSSNTERDRGGQSKILRSVFQTVGARRIVLDTIESLFGGLSNPAILRMELRRLFGWLKARGVTTIITGEVGEGTLTRQGLEEYVSDCVILLDHRMRDQASIRRLRVVKYRGSTHGTDEYPFLIDAEGISVLPITSLALDYDASSERISTGVPAMDAMMGGKGYYRGSSVLVSGTAGTGKSSLAAHFVDVACRRGERCLYTAFEESRGQIIRNMRSIGIDLEPWVQQGLLQFYTARPTIYGLEMHLATLHKMIDGFNPGVVVLDPITNLSATGLNAEVKSMLVRLMDFLKGRQITSLFTSIMSSGDPLQHSEEDISSLMDTWILLRGVEETGGTRKRQVYILKSRGMPHSSQVREFELTDRGIVLKHAGRRKTAAKRGRK